MIKSYNLYGCKNIIEIKFLDAVGTNVRIGSRFNNIIDIRACRNDDVNLDYATDKVFKDFWVLFYQSIKARFSYDGLSKGRILEPMIRNPNGQLSSHGWDEILQSKLAFLEKLEKFFSKCLFRPKYIFDRTIGDHVRDVKFRLFKE